MREGKDVGVDVDVDVDVDLIEVVDLENDHILYTPISRRGKNTKDPISVELYTGQKRLRKAIMASRIKTPIDLTKEDEEDEEVKEIKNPFSTFPFSKTERGQSSKPAAFMCEICAEPKPSNESFKIKGCSHSYCSECMMRYVASKIQDNVLSIGCPEFKCQGVLEPEFCRSILPDQVFDRWCSALCENLILGSQKFYCPFKDCSALLVDDGGVTVKESVCPHCFRMFCAQCMVPWHSEISCGDFQKLNENERGREDIMVMKLAKEKKWQRCPKCKILVERVDGCPYIKCRCGFSFCYHCAAPMHPSNHNCNKCKGR